MVGSAFGFKNSDFVVPIGSTVDVGFGTGLAVEAKSFTDSYYDTGQPSDYASDLVVYEKGDGFGGTWRENTYPGLSCDVPSHLYSYSFALSSEWSHRSRARSSGSSAGSRR